jgi:MFS family permease
MAAERVDSTERDHLVRRSTAMLVGAQVALWGSLGVFAGFGPITASDISDSASTVAVFFGVYYLGAAAAARLVGRWMDRVGRRPGLALGYVLLAVSGAVTFAATAARWTEGFVASGVVIGLGSGAALLGRAAVADMYPPERRGRAVGLLVVAGTIGAVGGPLLAAAVHALARSYALPDPLALPWLLVTGLALVALGFVLSVRPDPRRLAIGTAGDSPGVRSPGAVLRQRPAAVALVAIAVGQAVMVTFMGVVPALLRAHHEPGLTVSIVVSLHLAGMFALSPLIGAALDRWGRRTGLLAGALASAAGVGVGLVSTSPLVAAVGLVLIGVGWSAAYLGSTAVVSDLAAPSERAGALGLTDLVAALAAALGVLGGAALLQLAGFTALSVTGLALLLVPIGLLVPLREAAPGSWRVGREAHIPAG